MSTIDRQRIAAVKALEAMGYRFREDKWLVPDATGGSPEADAMHAQLVHRADQLEVGGDSLGENSATIRMRIAGGGGMKGRA